MLRSRIGLGLVLACLVLSLTACGGGDDDSMTPPMPGNGGGEEPVTPPTPPTDSTPLTSEEVERAFFAAQPVALDRAAGASPTFGSVSQGSNVQDGMTTDSVSIAYSPHDNRFHPVATIRTGDGTELRSNDDPARDEVMLPSGRIIYLDEVSDESVVNHYAPEDWRLAEEEVFKGHVEHYGETDGRAMFIERYGSYPIGDEVPYNRESRPVRYSSGQEGVFGLEDVASEYLQHPRAGRTFREVIIPNAAQGSIQGPAHYTQMIVNAYTDYPSAAAAGDDDHLSWGIWMYYARTPSALGDWGLGAFTDGIETLVGNVPITGTASYSGYTSGLANKGGAPTLDNLDDEAYWASRTFRFLGQVSLQADFATASVQGQVTNFQQEYGNEQGFLSSLAIDLDAASITSGTFTGDARATAGLAGAVGKWGGQFFGTPDAGEAPPAAGGTWGVTQGTGDDDWKMIGGFGAWKP